MAKTAASTSGVSPVICSASWLSHHLGVVLHGGGDLLLLVLAG